MSQHKEKTNVLALISVFIFMAVFFYFFFSHLFMNTDGLVEKNVGKEETHEKAEVKEEVAATYSLDKPSAESISYGKEKYLAVCAACHGNTGLGDGPAGAALNPPARNFTKLADFKNEANAKGVFKTLNEGIPGSSMASFSFLPESDRNAIAHFIVSLIPKSDGSKGTVSKKKVVKVDPYLAAKLNSAAVEIAMKSLATHSKKASVLSSKNKFEELKNLFNGYSKRVKAASYSTVYSKVDLSEAKSSFSSFKRFVTSQNVFNVLGESYSTLTDDELMDLYKQIK